MKRLAALSVLLSLSLGVLYFAGPVHAQDVTPSPANIVTPPPINLDLGGTSEADYKKQLDALQTTYRNQLTTYRSDEKAFQINKDQYYKIQTLASLEAAVRQTRQVMLSRLDVLNTYLQIAKLTLQNTKGIETSVKSDQLQQIDILSDDLKTHRKNVEQASDRNSLLGVAVQFASLAPRIDATSTRVSYLVAYGNLQTVDDKTSTIKQELQQQIEQTETDPLKLAAKKRGFDEVQRNIDDVNPALLSVRAALNPTSKNQQDLANANLPGKFASIYGALSRSLSYLQELVKS